MMMKHDDFKRSNINKPRKMNWWAPPIRTINPVSTEQEDSKPKKRFSFDSDKARSVFVGVSIALFGVITGSVTIYESGYTDGYEKAEDDYPKNLQEVEEDLSEARSLIVKLQGELDKVKGENEDNLNKIAELEEEAVVTEEKEEVLDTIQADNLRLPVETEIKEESTMMFFDKLNISLVHIEPSSTDGNRATLSVSASEEETMTTKALQVGDKVLYEAGNMKYEILITSMDLFKINVHVVELPMQ